ncbi:MAG: alanine racemase [Gemmatimonadota bacterium]|nr:alanine racemase [Gemmatimonadota bacterium]
MNTQLTRAWVDVDLGALRDNGAMLTRLAQAPLLPMVKANAYGLGAVQVAHALETLEPWGFGVATVDEGVELRDAGISRPIVVFTSLAPAELRAALDARLTPTLSLSEDIAAWSGLGGGAWWLDIDTGMNRAGVRWDAIQRVADAVRRSPPESAFTHFHSAERNDGSLAEQEKRFQYALDALPVRPQLVHSDNSAAIVRRDRPRWPLIRPGLFLYGVGSGAGARIEPETVVALRARIVELHTVPDGETVSYSAAYRAVGERCIATLAIGYADGYPRALSGRGRAIVSGRMAPVAGVVTMDMTMLDVTDIPCAVGDVVTLVGASGDVRLDAAEVAREADTVAYELFTGFGVRLPRVYSGARS